MQHSEWGLLIVVYLFLGGISAGAMVISGLANYIGRQERYTHVARVGAFLAPWPVALGTGLLVFDLGRPVYFWKLFTAFEPESPMWIGTWLLSLFLAVSLPYLNLFLPEERRLWKPKNVALWKNLLAAAGLPIGVGVGIYTGVLLGAVPARPFWNTPMVAQLFLFSGLSSGAALLILLERRLGSEPGPAEDRRLLVSADVIFILLELFIILPYIVHGALSTLATRQSLQLLFGGTLAWLFWLGVVLLGLLVPLLAEVASLAPTLAGERPLRIPHAVEATAAVLVLVGGFLLRFVFVYAGQISRIS